MLTVPFREYVRRDVARDAVRAEVKANPDAAHYFGLSPYEVPDGVTAIVLGDEACVFNFDYSVSEEPEKFLRPASRDGSIDVVLGRLTRKILQVYVHKPRLTLRAGNPEIDTAIVPSWLAGVPSHSAKSATRSAQLVNAILHAMPASFRKEVLKAIDSDLSNQKR